MSVYMLGKSCVQPLNFIGLCQLLEKDDLYLIYTHDVNTNYSNIINHTNKVIISKEVISMSMSTYLLVKANYLIEKNHKQKSTSNRNVLYVSKSLIIWQWQSTWKIRKPVAIVGDRKHLSTQWELFVHIRKTKLEHGLKSCWLHR